MDDNYLWRDIKQGDRQALKKLHGKYFHPMCFYAARSIRGNSCLAEELVSDCFIKLWENRKKIDIQTSVTHYLFIILHNAVIDQFRKKNMLTEPYSQEFSAPGDEDEFDKQLEYARLHLAVRKLPDQCRKVLELAVFESLTYKEIAEKLQISCNTVKTQIGRAYKRLREILGPKD